MKFKAPEIPRNFSSKGSSSKKQECWKSVVDTIIAGLTRENSSAIVTHPPGAKSKKSNKNQKIQNPHVSAKCIQKFVLDWRVDNLEFLMGYCRESNVNWNQCSSAISIFSEPFVAGKEIDRESTWGLRLKSHCPYNGSYYFSLHVCLQDFVNNGRSDEKVIEASFVLHLIDENGQIFLSKQRQNVTFEPISSKDDPSINYSGFDDFVSFQDVNNKENKLVGKNSLYFRLDLYIPSKMLETEIACPEKFFTDFQQSQSLKKSITEKYLEQPRGDSVEVVGCNHSFHLGYEYLERYPKLKALCAEDKACGNCGVISIPCYSDNAVNAMLCFVVGDFTQYVTKLDEAIEVLRIAHEFDLTVLMNDAWLNILLLLKLEHIPSIIVFTRQYKPPEFVNNYVCVLLLTFLYELQQLKVYQYWLWKEPLAFASIFLPDRERKDISHQESPESLKYSHKYFVHEIHRMSCQEIPALTSVGSSFKEMNSESQSEPEPADSDSVGDDDASDGAIRVIDEEFLENSMNDAGHDNACKCYLCQQSNVFARERLLIDYLAKVRLIQETHRKTKG